MAWADLRRSFVPRVPAWLGGAAAVLILWYGVGGWLAAGIDPDPNLRPTSEQLPPGGSVAAAMAARLIEREVDDHWTPNDGVWSRAALLDNKPAYQDGLRRTVAAAVAAMGEDPDLARASVALATPSTKGWLFGGSAESEYRDAADALAAYNARRGAGEIAAGGSGSRVALLIGALDARLGQAASGSERAITGRAAPRDRPADEEFYAVRGTAYAAAMLLRALKEDNATLVRTRQLDLAWNEATEALDNAVAVHPAMVGESDLTAQGYHLLLARNKLRDLATAAGGTR